MLLRKYVHLFANGTRLKRVALSPILRRGITNETVNGKPYYVTTPIFYPNANPHIGHLHSIVIADIFARYAKIVRPNRSVRFMTGTDEHGLKIQKAAQETGMDPLDFCNELSQQFRLLLQKAQVSKHYFARTTFREHVEAVQHLWSELNAKDLLYKGTHEGWYSITDECFYTDKQVQRVTEGDQERHISTETGSKVEWSKEENYMFRLSAFRESLLSHFQSHPEAIFPAQYHADVISALSSPLDDLSVSRPASRLPWGIPVPNDPDHTIYVWIDALTAYLSGCGYPWASTGGDGTSHGWPPNIQVIGKDILRFHAIYFPAMLQALGLPLTHRLLTHSHWTVRRKKMSKSIGNVADPFQVLEDFQSDLVRYYLAHVGGRFKDDVDWSESQMRTQAKVITGQMGNLLMRIATAKIQQRSKAKGLRRPTELLRQADKGTGLHDLLKRLQTLGSNYQQKMDALLLTDAIDDVVLTLEMANATMSKSKPWAPTTPASLVTVVYTTLLETLRICGILFQPITPAACQLLLDELGVPENERTLEYAVLGKGTIGKLGDIQAPAVRLFQTPKRPD